jgi:hypothetical protein
MVNLNNQYPTIFGIVVDRQSPEKRNEIKVRWIPAYMNIADNDLPWSEVVNSLTDTSTIIDLIPGDIVMGTFLDAEKQRPLVYGKINSIPDGWKSTPQIMTLLINDGKLHPSNATRVPGQPSLSGTGRGVIEGSVIDKSNNNIVHVCDISLEMKRAAAWVRLKYSELMQAIRNGIRAILNALGLSPEGVSARFKELAQNVIRALKKVQKFFREVSDALTIVQQFIREVNELIKWILSLPAKILALLSDCLARLQRSLAIGFSELFKDASGGSVGTDVVQVFQEVKNTFSAAVQTASVAASTAATAAETATLVGQSSNTVKSFRI